MIHSFSYTDYTFHLITSFPFELSRQLSYIAKPINLINLYGEMTDKYSLHS